MRGIRTDAWGARRVAEDTAWGRYLRNRLDRPDEASECDDPTRSNWQRYMRRDCLHLASAVGARMRLPVGRLMKGGQLAHAFVILPNHDGVPDRWPCLDWSGVRTLKRIRADLHDAWGRLTFDGDVSPMKAHSDALRDARTRQHIAAAMRIDWPRVSPAGLHRGRLRYLDVIDVSQPHAPARRRRPDVIDVR